MRVEQRGTPRQILKLATYKATNVTPTKVRTLKAMRSGKDKVNLSWAGGGCGTTSYAVTKVAPDGTFSTVSETTKKHVKVAIGPVVKRKKGEKAPRTTYYVEAVGPHGDYAPSAKVIVK